MIRSGYLVDLSEGMQFDDKNHSWVHAMSVGEWDHPLWGKIKLTPERIKRFSDNVANRVRGIDLDIDYDHKSRTDEAAGWVKASEARDDGLWLDVEWTEDAVGKIKQKKYRYFSPEFTDEWVDPKTKTTHKDVLLGGGLTNRPFLKDLVPVNFTEVFDTTPKSPPTDNERKPMDPKLLRQLVGLPEDATDDQVQAKLKELNSSKQDPPKADEKKEPTPEEQLTALAEKLGLSKEVIKLAETQPALKALLDTTASQQVQLAEVQAALRLSEVNGAIVKLSDKAKDKGGSIPPAVQDELRQALLASPSKKFSESIVSLFEKQLDVQLAELGERGTNNQQRQQTDNPVKAFSDAVESAMKANTNLGYADAVERVSTEQPALFEEYRQASFAFREN